MFVIRMKNYHWSHSEKDGGASLVNAVITADKMSLESKIVRYVKSMKQVKKAAAEAKKESLQLILQADSKTLWPMGLN